MKTALVRLLALATLATSMSAFAATGDSKSKNSVNPSANQQNGCASSSPDGNTDKKAKNDKKHQEESQEEKDFDRVLMSIYG